MRRIKLIKILFFIRNYIVIIVNITIDIALSNDHLSNEPLKIKMMLILMTKKLV